MNKTRRISKAVWKIVLVCGAVGALLWLGACSLPAVATSTPTVAATFTPTSTPTVIPTKTPIPTSTVTPIPAWITDFAEPILAVIKDREPDFVDDFSTANKGWEGWNAMWFQEGTYKIEDGVIHFRMNKGDAAFSNPVLDQKDFVLQADARMTKGDNGSRMQIFMHILSSDYWYCVFLNNNGQHNWSIGKMWAGRSKELAGGTDNLSPRGETIRVTIIASGSQAAIYLNGIPTAYFDDPDFDTKGKQNRNFFMCGTESSQTICEFDNVKFWNLGYMGEE